MVENSNSIKDICFQVRLRCILTALSEDFDLSPDSQIATWVREGVALLKKGEEITPELLDKIDRYGGTDHPDPWFT